MIPRTQAGKVLAEVVANMQDGEWNTDSRSAWDESVAAIEQEAVAAGRARLRVAVEGLRLHPIGGYEWECDECHSHFVNRPCHITGIVARRDAEVDSTEAPSDHDSLLDRAAVLALLEPAP